MKTMMAFCAMALLMLGAEVPAQHENVPESAPPQTESEDGLKIYISADMEGVVGVASDAQLGPGGLSSASIRILSVLRAQTSSRLPGSSK
jgi:hypothetical protein